MQTAPSPAKRSALPLWRTGRRAWPFAALTDQQRHENAKFEIAARNGRLAGPPSCFGVWA